MNISDIINEAPIQLSKSSAKAKDWIQKVYAKYPQTWQNNHLMPLGDEQFAMFELVPSMTKRDAVEVKWFQAYPLRQGVGTRAMRELQDMAKEDGVELTLYPWDKGQVSQAKLIKFYRQQGFKPTAKGAKSMSWSPVNEVADQPYKPIIQSNRAEKYVAIIPATDSGARIQIRITQETADPGTVEVGFFDETDIKNPTIAATGKGDAFRIFATVGAVVNAYVKKFGPDTIEFGGKSNESGRIKLYDMIARNIGRYLPGYHLVRDAEDLQAGEKRYKFSRVEESLNEAKKIKKPKTIIDGAVKTLINKGRSEDEAIADLKKAIDKKFYNESAGSTFTTKQQVIDYFTKRGKTAAQGASAWERGWRGPVKKKPELSTSEPRTDWQYKKENESVGIDENFADGKGPGRPGDSKRHGIPKKATIAQLEKHAKRPGRAGQLARWQLNMRRGKKKASEAISPIGNPPSPRLDPLRKPRRVEPVEPAVKVDIRREKPRDPNEFVYTKPRTQKDLGSLREDFNKGLIDDMWFLSGAFRAYKRPTKVRYETATTYGTLRTLEGPVAYEAGYKIITGPKGERYPIPPEEFAKLYDDNKDGTATPKKIPKWAKVADHSGSVKTSWGETLHFTKGNDVIVRHGKKDYGVVKKDIFDKTYGIEKGPTFSGIIFPDGPVNYTGHLGDRIVEREANIMKIAELLIKAKNEQSNKLKSIPVESAFIIKKRSGPGISVHKLQKPAPDNSIVYYSSTYHPEKNVRKTEDVIYVSE